MKKAATWVLGSLLLMSLMAVPAMAAQYPPTCTDSIGIWNIQNPAAPCHPVGGSSTGDTLWVGIGGIVTARDTKTSGVGVWLQLSGGGAYTGLNCFTANTIWPVAVGDSVIIRPSMVLEYNGETEIVSLTGSFGSNMYLYKIASGQPLPPFQNGTTTTFNNLTTNTAMEQWEGGLVKCVANPGMGPMRVARTYSTAFMVVDSACTTGTCDSVFVDVSTIPNPSLGVPALGTILQWLQGIVGQTTAGYRIRMRDDNDWYPSVNPPSLAQVYAISDDSVRVKFDKAVIQTSAESLENYALATFGATVNSATLESDGQCVMLSITNGLGHKVTETLTVSGVRAVSNGKTMSGAQSRTFWNGLTPIADIQAPQPDSLLLSPCQDRSTMAGVGSAVGSFPVTFRGVCTAAFPGGLYYLQDATTDRSGIAVYAPIAILTPGNQYLVVSGVQEYYNETESATNIYIRDEGAATMPDPVLQTVAVLADTTCDSGQSLTTGEEYEGMLVKMHYVAPTGNAGGPGYGFDVAGYWPAWTDSIHIRNVQSLTPWTFQADSATYIDVTGIQTFSFGTFQVSPRTDDDFVYYGPVGVDQKIPTSVSFSAWPNPARLTKVSFGLPKEADVELAVFDLIGRRVATLAKGVLPAGLHTREWNAIGSGPGVYFLRLRVDGETYNLRTISLK